ncbi:MAG: BTAD domain-containing putative transcriptional regulator [Gemmatimonadota bacterium]|nr:BTAD domain-containing putative transcriptional regulator [Gemmatimonadota bacterium]
MIHVRTLGGLDIRDGEDDRRLRSILSQPKRAALLVYLLLARPAGPVPRNRLLGLFWANSPEDRARNALSQALHVLRRGLGSGVIESEPNGDLRVDGEAVSCDALQFRAALDEGRLEDGLRLYGGPFLDGLEVSRSPGFERWLDLERDRLRELALGAASDLAEARLAAGNVTDAVHWSRQAVRWAPFDEAPVRRLMLLLDGVGDRAGALRAFDALEARLRRELGDGATDATRKLASGSVRIRRSPRPRPACRVRWARTGRIRAPSPRHAKRARTKRPSSSRLSMGCEESARSHASDASRPGRRAPSRSATRASKSRPPASRAAKMGPCQPMSARCLPKPQRRRPDQTATGSLDRISGTQASGRPPTRERTRGTIRPSSP